MDYFSFLPCLAVIPHLNSEKPGSHHAPSVLLIVQFQYSCIVVSDLFTYTSMGNNFINYSTVLMYNSFSLPSCRWYSFPKLLSSAPCSSSPSVKLFYTFVIQSDSFVTVCILGSPNFQNEFLEIYI